MPEREETKARLESLSDDGVIDKEQYRSSKLLIGYRKAFRIPLGEGYSCVLQIEPYGKYKSSRYMRLEWNPHRAGRVAPNPSEFIKDVLRYCVPSYTEDYLLNGRYTRLDFAFDLYRVPVESIIVFTMLRRSVSGRYYSPREVYDKTGYLNSQEIGDPESDRYLLIYDKRAERIYRKFEGNDEAYWRLLNGSSARRLTPLTRFEIRLRDINDIRDFVHNGENPFQNYEVQVFENLPLVQDDFFRSLLIDAAKRAGAYAVVSREKDRRKRQQLKNFLLEGPSPNWWNPEHLWENAHAAIAKAIGHPDAFVR
ncbi:hypothetical protein ACFQUU_19890 [Herbaspirillum sp. GCM10030257]|uniref:hypothetical protein n=1 Tax=Herbaspirillum sp. GCM10030257 TaxID=3273393 RepID=UPI003616D372